MKKSLSIFCILSLCFSTPTLFAQMPLPVAGAVMPSGLERIGVVAAAGGKVELTTPGQVGRVAQSGQPIFMGDLVSTDAKGHLQILLLDETVFTIGPNSAITIDKFVYDPKTHGGEIKASVTKGVFRYVSGKIAVKNPNNVTVKLPTTTLGFRGTIVGGSVGLDGQGLVGLLGPGDNNDAGAQTGSFTIEGYQGEQENVDRTGFGVGIGENGDLTDAFQLSGDQVNELTQGLGGGNGGGGGGGSGEGEGSGLGGDNMGDLSGETGALTGDNVSLTEGISGLADGMNDLSVFVAQNETPGGTPTSNITTLAQLEQITSGTYSYSVSNQPFSQTGPSSDEGTFSASWVANFDPAYRDISNIVVSITTSGIDENSATFGEVLFSSGQDGQAVFLTSDQANMSLKITLLNDGSNIAHDSQISVTYNDNHRTEGNGTATTSCQD